MLKIVRRLELRTVEQKCWRFLLSIVNHDNCVHLHQIADFFECAPLKISAWRIIQESKPGYSAAPNHMISSMQVNANNAKMQAHGHGLTGPGELNGAMFKQGGGHDDDDSDEDDDAEFSIFTGTTPTGVTGAEQSDAPDEGLLGSISKRYDHYVHPDKLPKGTPAAQVVKAWSFRLQEVFAECCNHDSDINMAEHAGMCAQASNRSETESQHESVGGEVERQFSAFSDGNSTFADRPISTQSNKTPILFQPRGGQRSNPRPSVAKKNSPYPRGSHMQHVTPSVEEGKEDEKDEEEEEEEEVLTPLDWRAELTRFYEANNLQEKVQSIDAILEAWQGRELDMMEVLHDKYEVYFDEDLRDRLSQ